MALAAQVQSGPIAVPVEGNCITRLVARVHLLKGVKVHDAIVRVREEAEGDFILCIRLRKQIVEDRPVLESDPVLVVSICDLEEKRVLLALDLVL